MLRSDRSQRTSLIDWAFPLTGIVLALSIAFGLGALAGSTQADPPTKEQQQQYAAAKTRYAEAVARQRADTDTNYAAYPTKYPDKCYYADDHDSADLCAQWRAAFAAEKAAEWTRNGFWISLAGGILSAIGLGCLLYSLRQTEGSLAAAQESNAIARNVQRPWLDFEIKIDRISNETTGLLVIMTVKVKNHSDFPAHSVLATGAGHLDKLGIDREEPIKSRELIEGLTGAPRTSEIGDAVFPGQKGKIRAFAAIENPENLDALRRIVFAKVVVGVRYKYDGGSGATIREFKVWGISEALAGMAPTSGLGVLPQATPLTEIQAATLLKIEPDRYKTKAT